MRALDAVALPQTVAIPNESQALSQRISFSPSQDLQLVPSLISVLLNIEPDMVYAGHDSSKPDTSSALLTSLNQLGERQLLSVVKWSKALPGKNHLQIVASNANVAVLVNCSRKVCAVNCLECKKKAAYSMCFSSSK